MTSGGRPWEENIESVLNRRIRNSQQAIIEALTEGEELPIRKRKALAYRLGQTPGPDPTEAVEILSRLALEDDSGKVRSFAVWALKDIGAAPDHETVAGLLSDADRSTRIAVTDWIRSNGGVDDAKQLLVFRSDEETSVRCALAKALGAFRAPEIYEALLVLMEDDDATVRHFAVNALVSQGNRDAVAKLEARMNVARGSEQRHLKRAISRLTVGD